MLELLAEPRVGLEAIEFGFRKLLVGSAVKPAIADVGNPELLVSISVDIVLIAGCSVSRSEPSMGESEDGRLVGAVLDRIMWPWGVLGLSRVNETGARVGSDATTSKKSLIGSLGMSPELPRDKTVIMAATAAIAVVAIKALVQVDMQGLPAAAIAIFLAPVAADAPIKMDAWTAIVWRAESYLESCPMLKISVDLMVRIIVVPLILQLMNV
jgi:hypothetical protein